MKFFVFIMAAASLLYAGPHEIDIRMAENFECTKTEFHFDEWGKGNLFIISWWSSNIVSVKQYKENIVDRVRTFYSSDDCSFRREESNTEILKGSVWGLYDLPKYEGHRITRSAGITRIEFDVKTSYGFDRYSCLDDYWDFSRNDWFWEKKADKCSECCDIRKNRAVNQAVNQKKTGRLSRR